MNRNTRPLFVNTGIMRIYGREYRLDTYYPMGLARPEYKMFHVWTSDATETHTFASEQGFENWIETKLDEGVQQRLC
jgi:hypothetical protein